MKIAILGTVGVPGRYGGFETLADHLVRYHQKLNCTDELTVYCSRTEYQDRPKRYLSAQLKYSWFKANGPQSVLYDCSTLINATLRGNRVLLLLGVSGAIILPVLRYFSKTRIIVNLDGIEWRRSKWSRPAKLFLRFSERMAVHFSHLVIADNQGIADYILTTYNKVAEIIPYGGDQAVVPFSDKTQSTLSSRHPNGYALALCRIEPENNVEMILQAFRLAKKSLVFVGNWENSSYGVGLRREYENDTGISLLDPIYDAEKLWKIRSGAFAYVHGHSAGGTNPSLVEMMHFGIPVFAYDCEFNRHTTENNAFFFSDKDELVDSLNNAQFDIEKPSMGSSLVEVARRRYTWNEVCGQYFSLFSRMDPDLKKLR